MDKILLRHYSNAAGILFRNPFLYMMEVLC